MNQLTISLSDGTERQVRLTDDLATIGRADGNTIQLDEVSVSGHHARLSRAGTDFFLKDLGSTNGTRVNGQAVTEALLQSGDRIEFGHVAATYTSDTPSGRQPLPESAKAGATPGATSARPTGFGSTTTYTKRPDKPDTVAVAVMAFGFVAIAAMGFAILRIFSLHPPA
jgi:pSer/pThr/pTyr-binding forkhead associated (FHA) protein